IPLSVNHPGLAALVSVVVLQNLGAEGARRGSLGYERQTRSGLQRFAAKLPGCPSAESSLSDRQERRPSPYPLPPVRLPVPSAIPDLRWANPRDILVCQPGTRVAAEASRHECRRRTCRVGPSLFPY